MLGGFLSWGLAIHENSVSFTVRRVSHPGGDGCFPRQVPRTTEFKEATHCFLDPTWEEATLVLVGLSLWLYFPALCGYSIPSGDKGRISTGKSLPSLKSEPFTPAHALHTSK
jgi:hypothetical protein